MRYFVVCAFLVVASVAISTAFDDSQFDEFMRDEAGHPLSRVRRARDNKVRDGPQSEADRKKNQQRKSCCGQNNDLKLLWNDDTKNIKKECFAQARKAAEAQRQGKKVPEYEGFITGNRTKEEYTCAVQCIGQKVEVLDHMGNVIKDRMASHVKKSYSNETWKFEVAEKVMDKCFEMTQKPSEGQVSTDTGAVTEGRSIEAKCNPNGITFIHCLWREMQLNCPASQLRENRKCDRLREKLRQGSLAAANSTTSSGF